MSNNYNDIINGLRVVTQLPLDKKTIVKDIDTLKDLGLNNNLAYTYYKGLIVLCTENNVQYIWREVVNNETGILDSHFIYPDNLIIDDINYSLKKYNFFIYSTETNNVIETDYQSLLNNVSINIGYKKDKNKKRKSSDEFPKKVTNLNNEYPIFQRNGYIGYKNPIEQNGGIYYPEYDNFVPKLIELDVLNLIINIDNNFENIKDYNPKLIISRYKPARNKTNKNPPLKPDGINYYPIKVKTTGNYKISKEESNIRPNKFPIQKYNVIDFGQEHYFSTNKKYEEFEDINNLELIARGQGKRSSYYNTSVTDINNYQDKLELYTWVYLDFHIEIEVNNIKYLSKKLGKVKMFCRFHKVKGIKHIRYKVL